MKKLIVLIIFTFSISLFSQEKKIEEGIKFEIKVYGVNVMPENARLILNRYND